MRLIVTVDQLFRAKYEEKSILTYRYLRVKPNLISDYHVYDSEPDYAHMSCFNRNFGDPEQPGAAMESVGDMSLTSDEGDMSVTSDTTEPYPGSPDRRDGPVSLEELFDL